MFDLIIRGGDVVTPEGVVRCDVAVAGETIAAIATPGALPTDSAKHLIDATGHIVMPGGIDPHVHLQHLAGADASRHLPTKFAPKPARPLISSAFVGICLGHHPTRADAIEAPPH
jgi:cytosine/adenosine deaminase-related metal-dependent hydrolase